jgi:hypothetical protein
MKRNIWGQFDQRGATIVFFAIVLFALLAFAALAIDIGHLVVTKNELQNAADAGALAGAANLYNSTGTAITDGLAISNAQTYSTSNESDNLPVDIVVNRDILIGHWSFGRGTASKGFTPASAPFTVVPIWGASDEELDKNTAFINAVQVTAWRESPTVIAWFARVLGFTGFRQSATAIGYIGFAGSIPPLGIDQPIAICEQSLTTGTGSGGLTCNIGRMLDSSGKQSSSNTAGWTNLQQPCSTANRSDMKSVICKGNQMFLDFGQTIGTTGGVQDISFRDVVDCWKDATLPAGYGPNDKPEKIWTIKLPVINCPSHNVSNCSQLTGVVTVDVVWMARDSYNIDADAPEKMEHPVRKDSWPNSADLTTKLVDLIKSGFTNMKKYTSAELNTLTVGDVFQTDGEARWVSFVQAFNLKNWNDQPAPFAKKSMYFLPGCHYNDPTGNSQGKNFGVLAKIPVLVN